MRTAAGDADLHAAVEREIFRAPLRAWTDEVGRLLVHFLREELRTLGALQRLDPPVGDPQPWLPAAFVARLAVCSWPGSVRQLRNVARRLAIVGRDAEVVPLAQVERLLDDARGAAGWPCAAHAGTAGSPRDAQPRRRVRSHPPGAKA